ncbi:MAG: MaoC family dehydratase [Peptococcaceae bacterium]
MAHHHSSLVIERTFAEISVGDTAEVTKTITEADVINFAGIIGDFNPLHVNKEFAQTSMFGQRVAHGMLTASFISTIVGTCIPGINALYLSQEVKFIKPVFINDTITVKAEVVEKIEHKRRVVLKTDIYNQREEMVVAGKGVAMVM